MTGPDRSPPHEIRAVDTEADLAACFPLMRQLRPHLTCEQEFAARWRRQVGVGYRLVALWVAGAPVALAGFRCQENLVYGVHCYVDDLVTDAAARRAGYGQKMMDWVTAEARALGCTRLVLDTPLTNVLGHRFYFRQGLLARSLRFSLELNGTAP
jgi:GNAT superfamily N-acetyltransferase